MSEWLDLLLADNHTYDPATSGLTATNVKDALDELAASGGGGLPDLSDMGGAQIGAFRKVVSTDVSGTLASATHSGGLLVTSGDVTIPNAVSDVGFTCVLVAGGEHTVTFDGTVLPAMASGDLMTVFVQSTSVIHTVLEDQNQVVSGDPYWSKVVSLIQGGGPNGGRAIADSGPMGGSWAIVGNAEWSSAQTKFGKNTLDFDGAGDYLSNSTFPLGVMNGQNDFTLELWIYPTSVTGTHTIASQDSGSGGVFNFELNTDKLAIFTYDHGEGTTYIFASSAAVTVNTWNHVAVTLESGTLRGYVDGVEAFSGSFSKYLPGGWINYGVNADASAGFLGYMTEMRMTVGVARYTTAFTPPTEEFPVG